MWYAQDTVYLFGRVQRMTTPPLSLRLRNHRYALLDRSYMTRYALRHLERWFPRHRLLDLSIHNHSSFAYKMSIVYHVRLQTPDGSPVLRTVRCSVPSRHTTFEVANAHRTMRAVWNVHTQTGALSIARPLGSDVRLRALFYESVEGTPLQHLLRTTRFRTTRPLYAAGVWLATLHRQRLPGGRRRSLADERREALYFRMNLGRFYPHGLPAVERFLATFFVARTRFARALQRATTLIHGDYNPNNILVQQDGGVAVIDFGNARRYDPMSDLANAVVQLGYVPGITPRDRGRATRALLAGYGSVLPLTRGRQQRYGLFLLWWSVQTLAYTATLPLTTMRNLQPVIARTTATARVALRFLDTRHGARH